MPSSTFNNDTETGWASVDEVQFIDGLRNKPLTSISAINKNNKYVSDKSKEIGVLKGKNLKASPKFTYFGDEIAHVKASLKQTKNSVFEKLSSQGDSEESERLINKAKSSKKLDIINNEKNNRRDGDKLPLLKSPNETKIPQECNYENVRLKRNRNVPPKLIIDLDKNGTFSSEKDSLEKKRLDSPASSESSFPNSLVGGQRTLGDGQESWKSASGSAKTDQTDVDFQDDSDDDLPGGTKIVTTAEVHSSDSFSKSDSSLTGNDSDAPADVDDEKLSVQYLSKLHDSLADSITNIENDDEDEEQFIDSIEIINIEKLKKEKQLKNGKSSEIKTRMGDTITTVPEENFQDVQSDSKPDEDETTPPPIPPKANQSNEETDTISVNEKEEKVVSDSPSEEFLKRTKSDLHLAKKKAHSDRRSSQRKLHRSKSSVESSQIHPLASASQLQYPNVDLIRRNYVNNLDQYYARSQLLSSGKILNPLLLDPMHELDYLHPDIGFSQMNYAMQAQIIQRLRQQQFLKQHQIQLQQRKHMQQHQDLVQHIHQRRLLQLQKQKAIRAEFSFGRKLDETFDEKGQRRAVSNNRDTRDKSRHSRSHGRSKSRRRSSSPSKFDNKSNRTARESRRRKKTPTTKIEKVKNIDTLDKPQDKYEIHDDTDFNYASIDQTAETGEKANIHTVADSGKIESQKSDKLKENSKIKAVKEVKTTVKKVEKNGLVYSSIALQPVDAKTDSDAKRRSRKSRSVSPKKDNNKEPAIPPQDYDGYEETLFQNSGKEKTDTKIHDGPYADPLDATPRIKRFLPAKGRSWVNHFPTSHHKNGETS